MNNTTNYKNPNPHESTNVFSRLSFLWFTKLCRKGLRCHLAFKDVYNNTSSDKSERVGNLLEKKWKDEIFRAKLHYDNPKLVTALRQTFLRYYMFCGVLQFVQLSILTPIVPVFFKKFLGVFENLDGTATSEIVMQMCWYGGEIVITTLILAFLSNHLTLLFNQLGMKVKIACSSLLYKKILRLNQSSLHQQLASQVIKLLANDLRKFDDFFNYLHQIWIIPIQTLIVTELIWTEISVSAIIGVGIFLALTIPINAYFAKLTSRLEEKVNEKTSERVKKMDEIVTEIHVIKSNGWEKPFEEKVEDIRKEEINFLTAVSYVKGIIISTAVFLQRAMIFITTSLCLLLGVTLSASQVFPMLQFYSILQLSLVTNMPKALAYWTDAKSTISELEEFLLLDEVLQPATIIDSSKTVAFNGIQASWDTSKKTLSDITVNIPSGSLCVIIGATKSGKSSLLQLILGELVQNAGSVTIGGTVSYASQIPWIYTSTVRNNITFNESYTSKRYKTVIKACALKDDFKLFERGDKMVISEDTQLTLAQRSRINLARCIYREADIYLLDEPFQFMNPENEAALLEECVNGYLKQKTRIVVTNQVRYLSASDYVVVLKDGGIEAQGTYAEILKFNIDFTDIAKLVNKIDDNPDKDQIISSKVFPLLSPKDLALVNDTIENETAGESLTETEKPGWKWNFLTSFQAIKKRFIGEDSVENKTDNETLNETKKTGGKWNILIPLQAFKKRFTGEDEVPLCEPEVQSLSNHDEEILPSRDKNVNTSLLDKVNSNTEQPASSMFSNKDSTKSEDFKKDSFDQNQRKHSFSESVVSVESLASVDFEETFSESSGSTYWEYIKSGGSFKVLIKLILLLLLAQLISNFADYWLTLITKQANTPNLCSPKPFKQLTQTLPIGPNEKIEVSVNVYNLQNTPNSTSSSQSISSSAVTCAAIFDINIALWIYTILIVLGVILLVYRSLYYYKAAMLASEHLHSKMLNSLLESPVNYFDQDNNQLTYSQKLEKSYNSADSSSNDNDIEVENSNHEQSGKHLHSSTHLAKTDVDENDVDKFDRAISEKDSEEGNDHINHGKIVQHFSKDVETVDKDLPQSLLETIQGILLSIGSFVLIIIVNPYMIIITIALGFALYKIRGWYAAIQKDLTIIEHKTDYPMHAHVTDTLNGIVTVRATGAQKALVREFDCHQDTHTGVWYLTLICSGAFGLWIDILTALYIALVIISFTILSQYNVINSSYVGLALSQSLILTGTVHYAVKQSGKVKNSMQSTEKVIEYTKFEKEGIFETPPDEKQLAWPYGGCIQFNDVSLRYPNLEVPALKNLTFSIASGQKIGIVGPSGSGKTSLIKAILRFALIEGVIIIDEVNIETIGLIDLRRKISLIPQRPVLFDDTLRFNLDPLREFSDEDIWKALETVNMKNKFSSLECRMKKSERGLSLSQKQLLCLARAILRKNKILILDNAMENVDVRTNEIIEEIINTKFSSSTVLMIAHNLKTVLNSDKVMVLENGVLMEFDYPLELLKNKEGYLTKMVAEANPVLSAELVDIAEDAFMRNVIEIVESVTELEEITYL